MTVGAVVVAAGAGTRFGGVPKQFRPLAGAPVLAWSGHALAGHPEVSELVVVVPADVAADPPGWLRRQADRLPAGGATRTDSVRRGIEALSLGHGLVLVHDGARPFVPPDLIDRVLGAAADGPAIPGLTPTDTVKMVTDLGTVLSTLDRDLLRTVQTPQAFPLELLRELHERAFREGRDATDDAMLAEAAGLPVRIVRGDPVNLKLTTHSDLALADWMVRSGAVAAVGIEPPPGAGE